MVKILDIPIYDKGLHSAITATVTQQEKKNWCISATGAHGLVHSKRNQQFKKILQSFHINLPDGMPTVWIGKIYGAKKMERCYGPDFFKGVMERSAAMEIKHFLCGGKNGVAEKLKEVCERKFNSKIVGTYFPEFIDIAQYDYKKIAEQINFSKADIVWIGLGTPKQEEFASRLSRSTNVRFICCVGAAFDFHTDRLKQAPAFIQKIGMEWMFRLLIEPKRLWKRYLYVVPLFILYNFAYIFQSKNIRK